MNFSIDQIDFAKTNQLVPAIIQNTTTKDVLMLGYMNRESLQQTIKEQKVTFFSRSKNRLWTKGEESGHFLYVDQISLDCDNDTLLIHATPKGPTCHLGTTTCWGEPKVNPIHFIYQLEKTIHQRKTDLPQHSYVASLFQKGINKIAQKVGEESIETIIEAKDNNEELFLSEAADLLFHYLVLLQAKDFTLDDVVTILQQREK